MSSLEFTPNPSLPSNEDITAHCVESGLPRGTTITDSSGSVIAWVKCGMNVTLGEALMQDWTATALREAGVSDVRVASVFRAFTAKYLNCTIGYIAMEHVEDTDCDSNDIDLVARAVKALISLKAPPTATLGRFGGDTSSIVHSFFFGWLPNAGYRTDQDFFDHIQNIFRYLRIDFQADLSNYDRYLCLSDFSPDNFKKTTSPDGQSVVVVLDFRAMCFMPLPFIEVALRKDRDSFRQSLITKLEEKKYSRGERRDVEALLSASGQLVGYGTKPIVLPDGVSRIISYS
ncbi:hypothetical protein R3P38DRAFT_1116283 [Favolaschia claudopus]|uniref:Aminoglycoside phosphotransferase domain-containing protein n=1 Tax=Favolaschia claudopus TaxID=2862362 RepID=A0AAW0BAR7_9AGAR